MEIMGSMVVQCLACRFTRRKFRVQECSFPHDPQWIRGIEDRWINIMDEWMDGNKEILSLYNKVTYLHMY